MLSCNRSSLTLSTKTMVRLASFLLILCSFKAVTSEIPLVLNTWPFTEATERAWNSLQARKSYIEALVDGLSTCEELQCDGTVGYGGSPDENGETTLDALIFDGVKMDMGAVAALRRVKGAAGVAKHVLEHTKLSILAGDQATNFAKQMGFVEESLSTATSKDLWTTWKNKQYCQPNYWRNVRPNPEKSCGPYSPLTENDILQYQASKSKYSVTKENHDTIGMIVIDKDGSITAGTSTNGLKFKIPGRVGDSPIPGAGAYADALVGAATATGDGDIMMRFLPSFLAVEELRRGASPKNAALIAIDRIKSAYPDFFGAVIVADTYGNHAAACNGMPTFKYSAINRTLNTVTVVEVKC